MTQSTATVGQRYVSDTEPELGLGLVLSVDDGRVEIGFPAARERRTYALKEAPLSRVRYTAGERIKHQDGQRLVVAEVVEQGGCLLYQTRSDEGETRAVPEFELDSFVQFSKPRERLFAGQIDRSNNFSLRYQSQLLRHEQRQGPAYGLAGPRVSLLPHQLYIAQQVASRYAPRVLLADEVGLGKTIEAGLILHRQLITRRVRRALIVVPSPLLHQWLVEMLRRFNLSFTLLDEERCRALEGADQEDPLDFELDDEQLLEQIEGEAINPFESAQLVLCSLDFLTASELRQQQALDAEWDMLLVDEAHHLRWSPGAASAEYKAIEQLAQRAQSLLLLTATPEQLGLESHFARLRLLDPDRYYDFDTFVQEQQSYQPLNQLVQDLLALKPQSPESKGEISAAIQHRLAHYLAKTAVNRAVKVGAEQSLAQTIDDMIAVLLDQHGTGRVLMRNTRHAVAGFPARHLQQYPVVLDEANAQALAAQPLNTQLHPELFWQGERDWWLNDPRVAWLKTLIKTLRGKKILVICADGDTAQSLELYLRLRQGIASAVFHEDMNLIARDRAAAHFADAQEGAQVLIASEIGSEGRNFQFAQDLVLFDLPLNPDLLEQRIGRLDRIGQRGDINIHVPVYALGEGAEPVTAQQKLAHWYHRGINAFEHTCAIGHTAFAEFGDELMQILASSSASVDELVQRTSTFAAELNAQLQAGRDRLLELNSCRPEQAQALIEQLETDNHASTLPDYLARVLDSFNVDYERESDTRWIIHPGEHMKVEPFPALPDSGLTATFARDQALTREDLSFMTWEHPLVTGAQELILDSEFGNTAVATLKLPPLKPGTLMVEAIFCLYSPAPTELQLHRSLAQPLKRVLLDATGKNFADALGADKLNKLLKKVPRASAQELVRHSRSQLTEMIDNAERAAEPYLHEQISAASETVKQTLNKEVTRLKDLAAVNPNVRAEEIQFVEQRLEQSLQYLQQASLKLDAVRVIIAV